MITLLLQAAAALLSLAAISPLQLRVRGPECRRRFYLGALWPVTSPRRIPITTPKPTTTAPVTTTEDRQQALSNDSVLFGETNEVVINCDPGESDDKVVSRLIQEHGKFEYKFYFFMKAIQFIYHSLFRMIHPCRRLWWQPLTPWTTSSLHWWPPGRLSTRTSSTRRRFSSRRSSSQ